MRKTDAIGRRTRTMRQPRGKRIGLRPRDLLWFRKLHEHGPLPTSYLYAFSKHLAHDRVRTLKRLADLYNEGNHLDRPHQQFQTIDARYNQLVYALNERGERIVKEAGDWSPYAGHRGGPWVHRLMVSCITASLELAASAHPNLRFIPQHEILERAEAGLTVPVSYRNHLGKEEKRNLIPDALCGLEYQRGPKRRYRFFLIEADRNTEPNVSSRGNRKSFTRSVSQYREFIGNGRYKRHLKLTTPMMVLTVTTNTRHMEHLIKTVKALSPSGQNSFMCFQTITDFAAPFKPPSPLTTLLSEPWQRAECEPFYLDQV